MKRHPPQNRVGFILINRNNQHSIVVHAAFDDLFFLKKFAQDHWVIANDHVGFVGAEGDFLIRDFIADIEINDFVFAHLDFYNVCDVGIAFCNKLIEGFNECPRLRIIACFV